MTASHHCSRRAASSRCRSSKKGQARSVTLELRRPFGGKRFKGTVKIPGLHAHCLGFGFHIERGLDRHVPFGVELALGHRVRKRWTARQVARERLSVDERI